MLETILSTAGYRVGCYTSPHLLRYNERIRIFGYCVTDEALCQAFEQVETARQSITLTYFEFGTLAAMCLFCQNPLDIVILEVGLGGRLDAVNVFDSTVALITPIGIDHVDWLGTDRESIGFEKAGIFRAQCPAICNDLDPPQRLLEQAQRLSAPLYCLGRDFTYSQTSAISWQWQSHQQDYVDLPLPSLAGDFQIANAAGVIMVLNLLQKTFPIALTTLRQGLMNTTLPGRLQMLMGRVTCIVDVAHNVLGVQILKNALKQFPCNGQTHALVGILQDKDSASMFNTMRDTVHHWHLAPLATPRSATVEQLVQQLKILGITSIHTYSTIATAYHFLSETLSTQDRIVVFGSFFTVAEVLKLHRY
jgi:dihydrofolate synthase/folylpolyglutamate synthase